MVSLEVQQAILQKALKANPIPFTHHDGTFQWEANTRVRSKSTDRVYDVRIDIVIKSSHKLFAQLQACLCKDDGVRFEDLMIVAMLNPRLDGRIRFQGLPRTDGEYDFLKFAKRVQDSKAK